MPNTKRNPFHSLAGYLILCHMYYLIRNWVSLIYPNPSLNSELNFLGSNAIICDACLCGEVFLVSSLKWLENVKAIKFAIDWNTFQLTTGTSQTIWKWESHFPLQILKKLTLRNWFCINLYHNAISVVVIPCETLCSTIVSVEGTIVFQELSEFTTRFYSMS